MTHQPDEPELEFGQPDVELDTRPRRVSLAPKYQTLATQDYYVEAPVHGIPASTRLDPAMKQSLQYIVQSGKTRYRTEGELMRAAVYWFVREKLLTRMEGGFQDDMQRRHLLLLQAQRSARIHDAKTFAKKTLENLHTMMDCSAFGDAVELFVDVVTGLREEEDVTFRNLALKILYDDLRITGVRQAAEAKMGEVVVDAENES